MKQLDETMIYLFWPNNFAKRKNKSKTMSAMTKGDRFLLFRFYIRTLTSLSPLLLLFIVFVFFMILILILIIILYETNLTYLQLDSNTTLVSIQFPFVVLSSVLRKLEIGDWRFEIGD